MASTGKITLVTAMLLAAGLAGCIGGDDVDLQQLSTQGLQVEVSPQSGEKDTEFTFDASATPGADQMNITWDFGDGQTATGPTVTHVFAYTNALYEVEVTAQIGNQTFTESIEVPVGSGQNAKPSVHAQANKDWVAHGETVELVAHTSDDDGDPVNVTWLLAEKQGGASDGHDHDHGSGAAGGSNYGIPEEIATGENTEISFDESGTYRLFARATDPKGASAEHTVDIKVTQTVPKTTFTFEKANTLAVGTGGAAISNEIYRLMQPSQNTYIDAARYDVRLIYPGTGTFSLDWSNSTGPADLDLYLYNEQEEALVELDETDPTATSASTTVDLKDGSYTIIVAAQAGADIPYTVTLDLDLLIPGLTLEEKGHDDGHEHEH